MYLCGDGKKDCSVARPEGDGTGERERESDNISSIILRNIWEFPKEGGPNMVP